jgi:hypothetical protein
MASKQGPTVPIFDSEGHIKGSLPNGGKNVPTPSTIPPVEMIAGAPGSSKGYLKAQGMLRAAAEPWKRWGFATNIKIDEGSLTLVLSKSVIRAVTGNIMDYVHDNTYLYDSCNERHIHMTPLDQGLCNAGIPVDPYSNRFPQPQLSYKGNPDIFVLELSLRNQALAPVLELMDYLATGGAGVRGEFSGFDDDNEGTSMHARFGADPDSFELQYENLVLTSEPELESLRAKAARWDALPEKIKAIPTQPTTQWGEHGDHDMKSKILSMLKE